MCLACEALKGGKPQNAGHPEAGKARRETSLLQTVLHEEILAIDLQ